MKKLQETIKFINTYDIKTINFNNNVIYYMYDYYKKWFVDKYPNNKAYKDSYNSFISLKNFEYNNYKSYKFPAAIKKFLERFDSSWCICTVPGHEKTNDDNDYNSIAAVIDMIYSEIKPNKYYNLIKRRYDIEEKHLSKNRKFDIKFEQNSLKLNEKYNIKNKNIIIFDDITTTGLSLLACKELLLSAGAAKVVMIALGRTKEVNNGYK